MDDVHRQADHVTISANYMALKAKTICKMGEDAGNLCHSNHPACRLPPDEHGNNIPPIATTCIMLTCCHMAVCLSLLTKV